ncbi:MAG: hypothetical protein K9I29_08595 [Bacteroidales bacterium]|nr:hypothetical protein [Bacteroidales bacterium]MCF8328341.1 hypothetical protein [Bacteroidales bacterium]
MTTIEPIEKGNFYHIYNHGVGRRNLFCEDANYKYFLQLYDKYISPIADSYAWVLMKNHFHLLVRIRENVVYKYSKADKSFDKGCNSSNADRSEERACNSSNADRSDDAVRFEEIKWETTDLSACEAPDSVKDHKIPKPENHFSHFFNAYTKALNKQLQTRGALFERPFKRKQIHDEEYLRQVILYIHNNPVHHGFCKHPSDYPWSSYLTFIKRNPTKLKRKQVMDWFGDKTNFEYMHNKILDIIEIERWLELE